MDTNAPTKSFDAPKEADWHRAISEAAYYIALKRKFLGEHALDDWLMAEQQVRQVISPDFSSDADDHTTSAIAWGGENPDAIPD